MRDEGGGGGGLTIFYFRFYIEVEALLQRRGGRASEKNCPGAQRLKFSPSPKGRAKFEHLGKRFFC